MKKKVYIKQVLAAFMLIVFTFSLTPKKILHRVFATHKDTVLKFSIVARNTTSLSNAGFNCHTDNLVAESPFVLDNNKFELSLSSLFPRQYSGIKKSFISTGHILSQLRGPPFSV
ncbi:MAG: hypothetical protein ABIO55_12240 [Ginsengibacter sp.]